MDISSSSVKMVEVVDAGKGALRVERYTIEPLPKDAVVDGNITNLEAVIEAVKRGWKKMAAMYPPYEAYQKQAGARQIPVVVLEPIGPA